MNKKEKIIDLIKSYVFDKVGEENIWEWIVSERPSWNGGTTELRFKTFEPFKELEIAFFLKSCWGIGFHRDGSLAWKFKYTDKELNNLTKNKDFIEAIDSFVLKYVREEDLD